MSKEEVSYTRIQFIKEDYKQSIAHFIELEDRYAIDARLLGRCIRINISDDCFLCITIPSLVVKNGFPEIEIPGIMEKYKADLDEWGCVKSYETLDNPDRMNVWISAVLVECFGKNSSNLLKSGIIQAEAEKVLHSLQVINPDAIRTPSDAHKNELCKVKMSVSLSEEGKMLVELEPFTAILGDRRGKISIADIRSAFHNANNPVSAPYEMLNNARINFAHHDTRATVLNCATAIEVMLKRKISIYFNENNIPQRLKDYILKKTDGFDKLTKLCKQININLVGKSNVEDNVVIVRNRVIHGGYVPSNEEAKAAYDNTRDMLKVMCVPMFELNAETLEVCTSLKDE